MCGFLGEYMFNDNIITENHTFESLLSYSKHRGPDSTGFFLKNNFQLGFNRLAILDISKKGNQPMVSPSNRYHIVFNGEIYNYKELKDCYNLNNLQSTSDTEVLLHLIELLGVHKTVELLNGMFSIAIIDTVNNSLSLVRDFAGIKPLFYGTSEKGIVFASQFNQICKHPLFEKGLNLRTDIMKEYFGLGYMQAPNTIYENIYQVKPGELIEFSLNDKMAKKNIYCSYSEDLDPNTDLYDFKNQKEYSGILNLIVKDQLISDVPIATFLSGGIDSPLITAIAKNHKKDIKAFTMGMNDIKYDESKKAAEYANKIKVDQIIETVDEDDLLKIIDEHFINISEPFGDYSSIPTYVISKLAGKEYKVMLSGDGGDELFFGYPRMQDIILKRHWFKIPFYVRRPLLRIALKLKLVDSWGPYTFKNVQNWILSKHEHIPKSYLNKFFPRNGYSKELENIYNIPKSLNKSGLLHWLRYNEFYAHLQRVLVKVDRMSMANSMEVRVPFLDKRSIDFAWKSLPKMKNNKFILKGILKDVLRQFYPNEMIEKEKKGFSVPVEKWLKNQLKNDVNKVVFETPIYGRDNLAEIEIKEFVSDFYKGNHNNSWGIWHIYAWQKWAIIEKLV